MKTMKIFDALKELNFKQDGMILSGFYFVYFLGHLGTNNKEAVSINVFNMGTHECCSKEIDDPYKERTLEEIKDILIELKIPGVTIETVEEIKNWRLKNVG